MDDKLKRIRQLIDIKEATDAELATLIGEASPQPASAEAKAKRGRPPKPTATAAEHPTKEMANGQGHPGSVEAEAAAGANQADD